MLQHRKNRRLIAKSENNNFAQSSKRDGKTNHEGKAFGIPIGSIGNLTENVACRVPVLRHGRKRDADCNWHDYVGLEKAETQPVENHGRHEIENQLRYAKEDWSNSKLT